MRPYYRRGGITIYHGDSREILPALPEHDLLLTDPPYGLGAARRGGDGRKKFSFGHGRKRVLTVLRGKVIQPTRFKNATWDDAPVERELLRLAISKATTQVIWGGPTYFDLGPARCLLVWDKLRGNTHYADAEVAWTNIDRAVRVFRYKWNGFIRQDREPRFHPTQKPVAVMVWALSFAPDAETVLDPFMGAGSTLIAAVRAGKRGTGIERDKSYCAIAAKRIDAAIAERRLARAA